MYFSASTFQEVFARLSMGLPRRTAASEDPFSRHTSTSLCWWAQRVDRFSVLILNAHHCRDGNYICLLSSTALLLTIDSKLLVPFQYNFTPCDSLPLHCFNSVISGVKISLSKSVIYASLHHRFQFLIIGHRYLLNFPCRTIPIRF